LLISGPNLRKMAVPESAPRNGTVCYYINSRERFVDLCLFLPKIPTLYQSFYSTAPRGEMDISRCIQQKYVQYMYK